ncbi:MAG TPA: patatin-like phospholipase family protein [Thermoanaerobaculia bacterium]|nr:patatin-like phospholipase family protein [Thermoanaerobaculia bacterium]
MRRLLIAIALLSAACAHYPVNPELQQPVNPSYGYRYATTTLPRLDDTFVILTFSGGGSRAAGFAYGVLREMEKTTMPDGHTMLDYIDVISSVSGGSFTAMQFGLKGRDGLDELKTSFLDQNIQGMLFKAAFLTPRNWIRLASPNFHRIDLAQQLYDDVLFHDVTFAQLLDIQRTKHRPLIIANSTELEMGARFEWTQDQFDPICSDLSKVRVSRAVAASSAFPGLLSPMVVNSYNGKCGYKLPEWVPNAEKDEAVNPSRTRMAVELKDYLNPKRQFLHLMDGGIADNIGLRGPLQALGSSDGNFTIQGDVNRRVIKKLLFLVVTAEPDASNVSIDARSKLPSIVTVLSNVINTPMGNYSFDTINQLRQTLQDLDVSQRTPAECQALGQRVCPDFKVRGADQQPIGLYQVIVSFPLVPDEKLRGRLNDIGTNFSLEPGQLDDLVLGAQEVLQGSGDFKRFVQDVTRGTPAPQP